ncbi:MAG: DUF6809 family protein [Candidatus Fimenecus sp.]
MRKILEQLYRGELDGSVQYVRADTNEAVREYKVLLHRQTICMDTLLNLLSEQEKAVFQNYEQAATEVALFEKEENFISAFRLGAKMMLNILSYTDGALTDFAGIE